MALYFDLLAFRLHTNLLFPSYYQLHGAAVCTVELNIKSISNIFNKIAKINKYMLINMNKDFF